jgi:hypothetical protein
MRKALGSPTQISDLAALLRALLHDCGEIPDRRESLPQMDSAAETMLHRLEVPIVRG